MEATFARLRAVLILLIGSMSLVVGGNAWAQSATIDFEKATLVSKFARYVSWPAEARQSEFIIGVYNDVEKYEYFSSFFVNKGVKGKDISVRLVKTLSEAKNVNILYIASPNQRKSLAMAEKVMSSSHVLIISENNNELANTMVDISYDEQQSTITFKVVDSNIVDAELTISDLAYFLDDNVDVLSVSPSFAKESKEAKQLLTLQNQIAKQQSALVQLNEKLNLSKESSEKYNLGLQQQSDRLKTSQDENAEKNREIKSKDKKLQQLEEKLQAQQAQLEKQQQLSASDASETTEQEQVQQQDPAQKEAQAQELLDLTEKLKKQQDITNNAVIKLANVTKDNKSLSSFQTLFYIFMLISIIALIVAYLMWKKSTNITSQPTLKTENDTLLPTREDQLIKSENLAALGYIATDITYAAGISLDSFQAQLEAAGDTKNVNTLKPVITLLENFNLIAADQDDTEIQNFDLIAYMQKMTMLYEFEFNQSDIVYNYSGEKELKIKSVPSYIALVLLNVINNSLKHGFDNNGNGKIALKIEKGVKSGAKITYSDDGKGMSKATLEQVFQPFFTTHSDRGYVGVGMSTTYDLIKNKLAGDIKIESQKGKGTTVTITLP